MWIRPISRLLILLAVLTVSGLLSIVSALNPGERACDAASLEAHGYEPIVGEAQEGGGEDSSAPDDCSVPITTRPERPSWSFLAIRTSGLHLPVLARARFRPPTLS
ncbi:hypothetical protein [Nitrospira sp. Kam-Ns4a]